MRQKKSKLLPVPSFMRSYAGESMRVPAMRAYGAVGSVGVDAAIVGDLDGDRVSDRLHRVGCSADAYEATEARTVSVVFRAGRACGAMACPHPGTFGGLCVACGADLSAALASQASKPEIKQHKTPLVHRAFQVSSSQARLIQEEDTRELRQKKKLLLVLDLDNTLIFAPSPTAFERPYLSEFLEASSRCYKLVLYTQGDDMHAQTSLKRIDPAGTYFGGRFIARKRGDDPEDKRLDYLHSSPAHIVIMDDRLDVWHEHLPNLLLVPPYEGITTDAYLKLVIPFLRALHANFFRRLDAGGDADVRVILTEDFKRRTLLSGLGIVFSGVIPQEAEPSSHSFWAAAELYGAKCHHHLHDEGVTHLITANEGTAKVQKAARMGLKIVRFDYLMEKWRWGMVSPDEQPQEADYTISLKVHPSAANASEAASAAPVALAPEAMREQAQLRSLKRAAVDAPPPKRVKARAHTTVSATAKPPAAPSAAASVPSSSPSSASSSPPSDAASPHAEDVAPSSASTPSDAASSGTTTLTNASAGGPRDASVERSDATTPK